MRKGETMTGRLPPTRFIRNKKIAMQVERTWLKIYESKILEI